MRFLLGRPARSGAPDWTRDGANEDILAADCPALSDGVADQDGLVGHRLGSITKQSLTPGNLRGLKFRERHPGNSPTTNTKAADY